MTAVLTGDTADSVHRLHDLVKTLNVSVIFENGCKSFPRKYKLSNKEVDRRPGASRSSAKLGQVSTRLQGTHESPSM